AGSSKSHEPRLTALLVATRPTLLPRLLALHESKPWMLVEDGGAKLREAEPRPSLDAWADVLPRYADLQRAVASRVDEMIAVGTPDHRLDSLASHFEALLRDDRVVNVAIDEPLSREELDRLFSLTPRMDADVETLEAR